MADSVITKQELIDAQKDAQTLEEVINGGPGKLVKTRLGREVYTLASVPQIDTMTREEVTEITETKANSVDVYQKTETYTKSEVDSTVAPKADQQYVDNALTVFTNGAAKFYPTIAAAQADIANISVKDKVEVGEAEFGGVWYKATAGSTYLTKSAYDPLTQAKADATTKANAAEVNAKGYADTNKLDLSKITYEYVDGNKIGAKTPRYTNLGISGGIAALDSVDSLVLRVNANNVLYMHNNTQKYTSALGSRLSFFSDDPNLNRSQTAISHTAVTETDTASGIIYQKVTVPIGAKYLMINTRTIVAGVTYNMTWAVHEGEFSASFVTGREVITSISSTPIEDKEAFKKSIGYTNQQLQDVERLKTSTKNLFTGEVITKRRINSLGAQLTSSDNDVVSNFIPVVPGNYYTVSGLDSSLINSIYFRFSGYSAANLD